MRMRLTTIGKCGAILAAAAIGATATHASQTGARASTPTALQLADHALSTVVGPDDEGSYRLIDPIGPGGVKTTDAIEEVYATTLQGGKYSPWAAYRDPFAPQPTAPGAPYKPGGGRARYHELRNGGNAR